MKLTPILFAAALMASPAVAEETVGEYCAAMASNAGNIMQARQNGASMADVLEQVSDKADILSTLTIMAYNRQRWQSPSMVARAVQDFRDQTHLYCLQTGGRMS